MSTKSPTPHRRHIGGGLCLRAWRPTDAPALADALATSHGHLRPWMDWIDRHQGLDGAVDYVRECEGRWLLREDFALAICGDDETTLLGGCGFHLRQGPWEQGAVEVGMWIRQSAAHKGTGTTALQELTSWGFARWGWRRLVWRCDGSNLASRKVAERCGYTLEGVLRQDGRNATDDDFRDTACYARLWDD